MANIHAIVFSKGVFEHHNELAVDTASVFLAISTDCSNLALLGEETVTLLDQNLLFLSSFQLDCVSITSICLFFDILQFRSLACIYIGIFYNTNSGECMTMCWAPNEPRKATMQIDFIPARCQLTYNDKDDVFLLTLSYESKALVFKIDASPLMHPVASFEPEQLTKFTSISNGIVVKNVMHFVVLDTRGTLSTIEIRDGKYQRRAFHKHRSSAGVNIILHESHIILHSHSDGIFYMHYNDLESDTINFRTIEHLLLPIGRPLIAVKPSLSSLRITLLFANQVRLKTSDAWGFQAPL